MRMRCATRSWFCSLIVLLSFASLISAQSRADLEAMITRDAGKKITLPGIELTLPKGWARAPAEAERMLGRVMVARVQDLLDGEDTPLLLHLTQKRDANQAALLARWKAEGGSALEGKAADFAGALCAWKSGDEDETELHYGVPVGTGIQELIVVVPGACDAPPTKIQELIASLKVTEKSTTALPMQPPKQEEQTQAPSSKPATKEDPLDLPWGAAVSRAMESMRIVLEPMSPVAEQRFEAQWMPLMDYPSQDVQDWLAQLQPLLDRFVQSYGELQELLASFEDDLLEAEMAAAYDHEPALRLAQRRIDQSSALLERRRKELALLKEQIVELGEPPDAQEQKQAARRRFHREMGELIAKLPPSTSLLDGEWSGRSHFRVQYEPDGEVQTEAGSSGTGRFYGRRFHRFYRKVRDLGSGLSLFYEYRYADDEFGPKIDRETVGYVVLFEHGESFLSGYSAVRNPFQYRYAIDGGTLRLEHRSISDEAVRQSKGWAPRIDWVSAERGSEDVDTPPLIHELESLVKMSPGGVQGLVMDGARQWQEAVGEDEMRLQRLGRVNWGKLVRAQIARSKAAQLREPPLFGAQDQAEAKALAAARQKEQEQRKEKLIFHQRNLELLRGDLERYEAQLGQAKDLASREQIQRWIDAKKADMQGERDAMQTVLTGNFTRTRTAWDMRNAARMREQTLRMALEHRVAKQRREGIERMIEAMPESERWDMRRFVDRQLSEHPLDVDKISQVGKAIGKRLQGHYGAVAAKSEEDAAFYDEVVKTQERYDKYVVTPTMMAGAVFIPGGGAVAAWHGAASGAISGYQQGSAAGKLYNDIRRDWGYTDKKGEIDDKGVAGMIVNIGTGIVTSYSRALSYTMTFAGGFYQQDPKTGKRRGLAGGVLDTALAVSYDQFSDNYKKYRQQCKLAEWRDAKRRADFEQEMHYGKAMVRDLHRAHVAHQKAPSAATRKALLGQVERIQNNPHARAAVFYGGSPKEIRSYRQAAELRAQGRVQALRSALQAKGVDVNNIDIQVRARQPRVAPGSDLGFVIKTKDGSGLTRRQNSSGDGHHIVALKDLRRLCADTAASLGRKEIPPVNPRRVPTACTVKMEGGTVLPIPTQAKKIALPSLPKARPDYEARFAVASRRIQEIVLPRLEQRRKAATSDESRQALRRSQSFWQSLQGACAEKQPTRISKRLRGQTGLHPLDALQQLEASLEQIDPSGR
jgi:hypothetical protein